MIRKLKSGKYRLYSRKRNPRTGKRRRRSPYELLGVPLPPVPWWELLKWSPEQLRDYLSASERPSGASDTGSRTPSASRSRSSQSSSAGSPLPEP